MTPSGAPGEDERVRPRPPEVYVEGGSTPAPPSASREIDPEIIAMDEAVSVRYDAFGRLPSSR